MSVADCVAVSRDLSAILDVEDVVPTAYTLEVSSPGLDRPLRGADDYRRFAGRFAKLVMREAVDGQKYFKGRLGGIADDDVLIDAEDGRQHRVPLGDHAMRTSRWSSSGNGKLESRRTCQTPCSRQSRRWRKKKASSRMSSSARLKKPSRRPRASYYKTGENLKTRFNLETGQVDLFALKQVVQEVANPATEIAIDEARQMYQQLYGDDVANSIELGDEMEFPKPTEVLGRIAAQTAKQVIFQKVREAERENIFAEYNQRIGEVVTGTVKRFENGDIILEVGRVEAVLPRKEQSRAESYAPSDRVRTVIKGVNRSAKGPQIVLSRTDPALLIKLFEQEVPEIYDGTVMIRAPSARQAIAPRWRSSRASVTWTRWAPASA